MTFTKEEMLIYMKVASMMNNAPRTGTFTQCTARYSGTRGDNSLDRFLAEVDTYKAAERITDEDAVRGLPILLDGDAADWWDVERQKNLTWTEAIDNLKRAFNPKTPAYLIYQEIVAIKQTGDMTTGVFINKKRKLLSQLNWDNIEEIKLDLVYGQLSEKMKDSIPRESVSNLDELVEKAQRVEERWLEKAASRRESHSVNHKSTQEHRETRYLADKRHKVCTLCHHKGHEAPECRKTKMASTTYEKPEKAKYSCYGCGTPGVVRTKCPKCAPTIPTTTNKKDNMDFCAIQNNLGPSFRPIVDIRIKKYQGTAYLDTGARMSVLSTELYNQLRRANHKFTPVQMNVTLADGKTQDLQVKTTMVSIKIEHKNIPTQCIVLPVENQNKTLLGADFIRQAEIIINLAQGIWSFADDCEKAFNLRLEKFHDGINHRLKVTRNSREQPPTQIKSLAVSPTHEVSPFLQFTNLSPMANTPEQRMEIDDYLGPVPTSPRKKIAAIQGQNKEFAEEGDELMKTINRSLQLFPEGSIDICQINVKDQTTRPKSSRLLRSGGRKPQNDFSLPTARKLPRSRGRKPQNDLSLPTARKSQNDLSLPTARELPRSKRRTRKTSYSLAAAEKELIAEISQLIDKLRRYHGLREKPLESSEAYHSSVTKSCNKAAAVPAQEKTICENTTILLDS